MIHLLLTTKLWLTFPVFGAMLCLLAVRLLARSGRLAQTAGRSLYSPVLLEPSSRNAAASKSRYDTPAPSPSGPLRHRVLIVGAGDVGQTVARSLEATGRHQVVGFVDDLPENEPLSEWPLLGRRSDTARLVEEYQIAEVIVAYAPTWQQMLTNELAITAPQVSVKVVPSFYETLLRVENVESHNDIALVTLTTYKLRDPVKRAADTLTAFFGLLFLSPLIALVALAIRLSSPGPVLFAQERIGRFGKAFILYKFRTMIPDAEAGTGPILANGTKDSRLTPIGKWLRLFRFDEIPQLWNVLRGEMSLIGPRPERPVFVQQFVERVPAYAQRHLVRPGITGLAQVCGGYHTDARDKLRFDLIYVSHRSLWLDLSILLRTVLVVFLPNPQVRVEKEKALG